MAAEEHSEDQLPGWVPLFTSLMILLCAFFIMMVSYCSFDSERTRVAIGSLRGTFGVSGSGQGALLGEDGSMLLEDPRKEDQENKKSAVRRKLQAVIKACEEKRGIRVRYDSKGLRIDAAERALFDLGSAEIKPESVPFLGEVADLIREAESKSVIEGHCDEADIKAMTYRSGWELSIKRALAITELFIEKDVQPRDLASYGYGEFNPLVVEEDGKPELNRRVTILLEIGGVEEMLNQNEEADGEEVETSV